MDPDLETAISSLMKEDFDFEGLFVREGVLDVETFIMLDENDFNRLNLNTGQRKKIIKVQREIQSESCCNTQKEPAKTDADEYYEEYVYTEQPGPSKHSLEKEIDIDQVFERTDKGRTIMELLRDGAPITVALMKAITVVLCKYLIELYGYHPDTKYKDVLAKSLVKKYDMLRSDVADFPQSVWFHENAAGPGRHRGKLQFHIEYLVKKFNKQVRHARVENMESDPLENPVEDSAKASTEEDLNDIIKRLKVAVPSDASYETIKQDWEKTLTTRSVLRKTENSDNLIEKIFELFPISSAFEGNLIDLDFVAMFPEYTDPVDKWSSMEGSILDKFKHLYPTVNNRFIRSLLIIKGKNPSRGVKRITKGPKKISNLLETIIEWINVEDDIKQFVASYGGTKNPVMVIKAPLYMEGESYIRVGKRYFSAGSDIEQAFYTLISTHYFVSCKFDPCLSNFYSFFTSAILNVTKPSTTVSAFLVQLKSKDK